MAKSSSLRVSGPFLIWFQELMGHLKGLADDCRSHDVVQYATYQDAVGRKNGHIHVMLRNATQVVAYEVGFAALTPDGTVWTWGDSRYPGCLGRNASPT